MTIVDKGKKVAIEGETCWGRSEPFGFMVVARRVGPTRTIKYDNSSVKPIKVRVSQMM